MPDFRGRTHQNVTQRPFSPPSFPARRKRRGRRKRVRNDHDGTNPCKQGFLSSVLVSSFPNRKLNLWFGFYSKSATTSQSAALTAPLPGADSPYQGEMFRRDKRGRDAVSHRLTERSSPASEYFRWCALLGSPSRGAGSAQPRLRGRRKFATACCLRRPYLFPCAGKDRGEKGAWLRLVHAASEFRRAPMFWFGVPLGGHLTSFLLRAA